jgi:hypothetical protein
LYLLKNELKRCGAARLLCFSGTMLIFKVILEKVILENIKPYGLDCHSRDGSGH